jgi:ribonucleotide reductase alpha subunit
MSVCRCMSSQEPLAGVEATGGSTGSSSCAHQRMLMRVPCDIRTGDVAAALETYDLTSRRAFPHAAPTLFNAGTPTSQRSGRFLMRFQEDSVEGIYQTLTQCAMISKSAGGICVVVSNVRFKVTYRRGTNGTSNGLVTILRCFTESARRVDPGGGKRKGSFALNLEPER